MAATISGTIRFEIDPALSDSMGVYSPMLHAILSIANGTSAGQADLVYGKRLTIASSGSPQLLDLNGGSLIGPNGDAVSFAKVCFIIVFNRDTTQTIIVGAGSNAFAAYLNSTSDKVKVLPAVDANTPGVMILGGMSATVYTVTAGTADIMQLAIAAGTNVIADVMLIGRSV